MNKTKTIRNPMWGFTLCLCIILTVPSQAFSQAHRNAKTTLQALSPKLNGFYNFTDPSQWHVKNTQIINEYVFKILNADSPDNLDGFSASFIQYTGGDLFSDRFSLFLLADVSLMALVGGSIAALMGDFPTMMLANPLPEHYFLTTGERVLLNHKDSFLTYARSRRADIPQLDELLDDMRYTHSPRNKDLFTIHVQTEYKIHKIRLSANQFYQLTMISSYLPKKQLSAFFQNTLLSDLSQPFLKTTSLAQTKLNAWVIEKQLIRNAEVSRLVHAPSLPKKTLKIAVPILASIATFYLVEEYILTDDASTDDPSSTHGLVEFGSIIDFMKSISVAIHAQDMVSLQETYHQFPLLTALLAKTITETPQALTQYKAYLYN